MSAVDYDDSLKRLLVHEGGYSNDPGDPGGPTNFGITIYDYRKYINANGTAADVRAMTVEQAKAIYRPKYWDALRCSDLPPGVDYAVFDYGVNSGISRAAKVLQRIVGVTVDGEIGDETIAAVRARDPKVLVAAICDERLAFLRGLGTWPTFGRGWGRRVAEVRVAALAMAGKTQGVTPPLDPPVATSGTPPWLARMNAILGLYEFPGSADNPAILAMAKACGGSIARDYKHDAIAWCALTVNYCLVASGLPGDGTLWALDFRKYGKTLAGPAVGAIATKTREGGGHVFLVIGRTKDGRLVGRGGNQSDMVCDETFDPAVCKYNWPSGYQLPLSVGMSSLPLVVPMPKVRKDVALPPPTEIGAGKGTVVEPKIAGKAAGGASAGGAVAALTWWGWVQAHPTEAALIVAGCVFLVVAVVSGLRAYFAVKKTAPMPVVPVAV